MTPLLDSRSRLCFNGGMTTHPFQPGDPVRIINPQTGAEITSGACMAKVIEPPTWAKPAPDTAYVRITPSIRPGMAYDNATYPWTWLQAEVMA